ncbi:MAG: DUF501 domain-containing protein [Ilumatobacteraceae bacterium]
MIHDDRRAVRDLLGREPQGRFEVVARDEEGRPRVIRNEPFLDDGTPMPTRYWLVDRASARAVSRLESTGGVRAAEAAVDADELAAAHSRYAAERDGEVERARSMGAVGPAPSGGVGGTRRGVKCLHAHYAWHLAGGDDPVGRWVAERLTATADDTTPSGCHLRQHPAEMAPRTSDGGDGTQNDGGDGERSALDIIVDAAATTFRHAGATVVVPIGPASLIAAALPDPNPPGPADLTNALGLVSDHLDDLVRAQPSLVDSRDVRVAGPEPWHLVAVERGHPGTEPPAVLERGAAEEVFRLLATETRAERLDNPGLDPARVDTVLGTCCLVLAVMRRLHLDQIAVIPADAA